jgi:prevent-host-death family protein
MAKRVVGSRELKTRLGRYLNRVRQGETIVVTDRHEPVAELRPLGQHENPRKAKLEKLAALGLVTCPTKAALRTVQPVRTGGRTAAAAIRADRDERG